MAAKLNGYRQAAPVDTIGPAPIPHMWKGYMGYCVVRVGPYQTWYAAREAARLAFVRILGGKPVDVLSVQVFPI